MLFKPKECEGCVLYNPALESRHVKDKASYEKLFAGRGFMSPDGSGSNGVVVMLESLGDNEVMDGLPVRPHAPAGSVFERAINRSPGLSRNQFKIGSTISCQPPFNKLTGTSWCESAINRCQVHRDRLLSSVPLRGPGYKQRVILALGAVPFRTLTGLDGEYLNLEAIRGYPIETPYGIVIGSYHPSHIVQGAQKLMGVLMLDMRKAVELAKNGFKKKQLDYKENPSLLECWNFYEECASNPDKPIAFDIETPNVGENGEMPDRIFSIQFSLAPQTGIFFNWFGQEEEIARKILALPNPKIGYNSWRFDGPMLESKGVVLNGRHDDVAWAFHHFQPDLTIENKEGEDASISSRFGLQYVASFFNMDFHWKYMKKFKEMQKHYGIADVDALQRIWSTLPDQMKRLGVWVGYDKVRYELEPVLIKMSKRGIPVDDVKRLELRKVIQADKEVNFDLMQSLVPKELRNIVPKGGYKRGWSAVKEKDGKVRMDDETRQFIESIKKVAPTHNLEIIIDENQTEDDGR